MRILFLIESFMAGGKERRLLELLKCLSGRPEIECELVIMSHEIFYTEIFGLGITVHQIVRRSKRDVSVLRKLYAVCKRLQPDIIHCWDSMTAVYSVPLTILSGAKLVNGMITNSIVGRSWKSRKWVRAKITFPFSAIVLSNSKAGLLAYNAPAKRSRCIYNGMDFKRFQQDEDRNTVRRILVGEDADERFIVGMVAAFEPRKDQETLLLAARLLLSKSRHFYFVLVGDGCTLEQNRERLPTELLENVIFLGRRNDVESLAAAFDLGVLLTNTKMHGEGISNAILEYMAAGKPVIATAGGGTDEIVMDGETGFLISPFNPEQLAEKIALLSTNRSLAARMGEQGKRRVALDFSIDAMVGSHLKTYNEIIGMQSARQEINTT